MATVSRMNRIFPVARRLAVYFFAMPSDFAFVVHVARNRRFSEDAAFISHAAYADRFSETVSTCE